MKLLHLGLFLLVGILVLKAITGYNKEGFDFQGRKSEQKNLFIKELLQFMLMKTYLLVLKAKQTRMLNVLLAL